MGFAVKGVCDGYPRLFRCESHFPEAVLGLDRFVPLSSPRFLLFFLEIHPPCSPAPLLANLLHQPPPTPPSCIVAAHPPLWRPLISIGSVIGFLPSSDACFTRTKNLRLPPLTAENDSTTWVVAMIVVKIVTACVVVVRHSLSLPVKVLILFVENTLFCRFEAKTALWRSDSLFQKYGIQEIPKMIKWKAPINADRAR